MTQSQTTEDEALFDGFLGVFSTSALILCGWLQFFAPMPIENEAEAIEAAAILVSRLNIEQVQPEKYIEPTSDEEPASAPAQVVKTNPGPATNKQPTGPASPPLLAKAIAAGIDLTGILNTPDLPSSIVSIGTEGTPMTTFRGPVVQNDDTIVKMPDFGRGVGQCKEGTVCVPTIAPPRATTTLSLQPKATGDQVPDILDPLPEDASALVGKVIRGGSGGVEACVGTALAKNPEMKGKLTGRWLIQSGRVVGAQLMANSTGDAELGACVLRVIKRFRFGEIESAEVGSYSWVVGAR